MEHDELDVPLLPVPATMTEAPLPPPATEPPITYRPPVRHDVSDEAIMAQAAAAHQRTIRIIDDLKKDLTEERAANKAKDMMLNELQVLLSQERNHAANLKADHEDALRHLHDDHHQVVQELADLRSFFGNVQASLGHLHSMFEAGGFPNPTVAKRKRGKQLPAVDANGNSGAGEAVSEQSGSQEAVAS